jgi:hypothetical protein
MISNASSIFSRPSNLRGVLAVIATVLLAATANAQVIVVKSTSKSLKAGTLLENNAKVSIPAGSSAVVVLPSGAMRTISGPFDGTASQLTKGSKANPDVFAAVKRYVVTGGSNSKSVGAVRSMAPASFSKPMPFSWRAIPINTSGDFCVEKGANISLIRSFTSRALTATIVDMKSRRRVQITFEQGVDNAPWPDELDIDPRVTYTVLIGGGGLPPRNLRLRLIKPLPAREDTLQVLHGQRCQAQFRTFIQELQVASN